MGAILKPFVFGVIAACITVMGLWLSIPLLFSAFTDSWVAWYPFLIIVPPLLIGGFVAASKMQSKYLSRYLLMGGAVGLVVMVLAIALTTRIGAFGFTAALAVGGSSISVFGAYLVALRRRSNVQTNP
jgi:hypothetical protein